MFCTKCGNQIKDGFKFCPKCGTPVYVEKEKVENGAKAQDEEMKKETSKKEPEPKQDVKGKDAAKSKTTSSSSESSKTSTSKHKNIPNPLIVEELAIEDVKKKAEQGDKAAMLRQAFRYEMGIGVKQDIVKANELYNNAGGKQTLPILERSHINSILPDPFYDSALLSTDETIDDEDNVFRVIPFVKDIVLDYSNKVERDKSQGQLTKEKSIEYKNEFIHRMKEVRNLYPELLLANMDETLTKDDFNNLLNDIKESVSTHYSLRWIPSLLGFSDSIDGNRFDIPSLYEINSDGIFTINYHNEKDKNNLFNQFVSTLLLQLPIKYIRLNLVDLDGICEYDTILRQIHPSIYWERPVTSEEELDNMINRLEKRKMEIIKKYGDFPDYCENNQEIPIPYEFIFFFNSTFDSQYDRILKVFSSSYRTGVHYVLFNKTNGIRFKNDDIFNPEKNEIYSSNQRLYKQIIDNGIIFTKLSKSRSIHKLTKKCDLILREAGVAKLQVVKAIKEACDIGLIDAKELVDCSPSILKSSVSFHEADLLRKKIEATGAICEIKEKKEVGARFNLNDLLPLEENNLENGYYIEGYGNYEVALKMREYMDSSNYNIEELKILTDSLGCNVKNRTDVAHEIIVKGGILLKAFPTIEQAQNYVNKSTLPNVSYNNKDRIRLIPYFVKHQKVDKIGIALYIPKDIISFYNIEQDLRFYFTKIGFPSALIKQIIDIVLKKTTVGVGTYDYFPTPKSKTRCISILEECIQSFHNLNNGFFFPDFLNNKYIMDFGFWGFNENNSSDLNIACEAIIRCEHDIHNIEKELDKLAIQEWGKGYAKEHLAFNDIIEDVAYLEVRKTKRNRIPILQSNFGSSNGLISPINIAGNNIYLQTCINYINREAEAKEETKVVSLTYDDSNMSYEDITNELLIDVGKNGKDDVSFRLDLVSHVHSFIIGQSGSGKSVFLHNIIGGAMLKYAPEDLHLYLLDFKLGGVEFNRYQGAKHVKALLVDNSDPQVTLEILRELLRNMTVRGKLLQKAGCSKIDEYNKLHQQERMPHVLVVADECHEMFNADDSIPRQVRNEISDIVIKIAKEGRNQGVHLIFATQTLSGTEISSEIINNVSDFYLLKCAQTDSERLVPNSSAITSELSTGQIYYHHVDEQVKFQAYYTDKEAAEKLMAAIVEKAKDHKSNGEFYFNGAQMFYLDESVKEQMLAVKGKSPTAFMGKAIDISQKDLFIKLNEDFSENVLLLGLNDQEQVTRTTMNLFVSLMMSAKLKHKDIAFKVIDCLNNEEGEVHELIFDLENEGYCEIIERRQRSKFFKELAQSVLDGTAEETILLILGQDRFRELKMDMELEESNNSKSSDDDDMMSISDDFFGDSSSSSTSVRTYRDAMNVILEKGPDYGVHTLLQIEKASNLLFEDYITPKVVFQKFKHLVMLKSDETAGVTLHLNDDIRLEKLSSDWERLRAYYYAEESDSYTLFTPYMPSKSKDIINMLKMI